MEAVTRNKHKSLKERTKLDTTMCQDGMTGSLRSRARCPCLPPRDCTSLERLTTQRTVSHFVIRCVTTDSPSCYFAQAYCTQQRSHQAHSIQTPPLITSSSLLRLNTLQTHKNLTTISHSARARANAILHVQNIIVGRFVHHPDWNPHVSTNDSHQIIGAHTTGTRRVQVQQTV